MSKKQTAVSWLEQQLNPNLKTMQGHIIQDLIEQAKQLEKEQIVEAYTEGYCNGIVCIPHPAKQYYSETYE